MPFYQDNEDFSIDDEQMSVDLDAFNLPITFLISGSASLRHRLIKLRTDSLFCSLMNTSLRQLAPENIWRSLLKGGRELEYCKQGQIVYESRKAQTSRQWYVVVLGSVQIFVDKQNEENLPDCRVEGREEEDKEERYEIFAGEVFGGFWISEKTQTREAEHVLVKTTAESSRLLELSGEKLEILLKDHSEIASLLLSRMGGKTLVHNTLDLIVIFYRYYASCCAHLI